MALRVHKYGGTSVDGAERIRAVAERVARARAAGDDLVVVVSAMGHTTDQLLALAHEVSKKPVRRELDMLITAGERVSMALLAMAIVDRGVDAISFTGSQSGILTDNAHSSARIVEIRPDRIRAELAKQRVVIVAGFQGVNPVTKEITTLGRGGSDTTAVAMAVVLGAACCEICTDVDGVYTADPRVVPGARRLDRLSYEVCAALAHAGGQVLHARCVDLAAAHRMPVVVRSSFDDGPGTTIEEATMEGGRVEAVAMKQVSIAVAEGNAGGRGEARGILEAVADAHPALDLVAHEQATDAHAALVWMGPKAEAEALAAHFRELRGPGGEWKLSLEHGATFVSAVGTGLTAKHAAAAEAALERAGVPVLALRLSHATLSLRVPADRGEDAMRALHAALVEPAATA